MDYKVKTEATIKVSMSVKEATKLRAAIFGLNPITGSTLDQFDDVLLAALEEVEYS